MTNGGTSEEFFEFYDTVMPILKELAELDQRLDPIRRSLMGAYLSFYTMAKMFEDLKDDAFVTPTRQSPGLPMVFCRDFSRAQGRAKETGFPKLVKKRFQPLEKESGTELSRRFKKLEKSLKGNKAIAILMIRPLDLSMRNASTALATISAAHRHVTLNEEQEQVLSEVASVLNDFSINPISITSVARPDKWDLTSSRGRGTLSEQLRRSWETRPGTQGL